MKRLYILTLFSVCLAACIFFFKKSTPTTIPSGEGLVIPKSWLAVNNSPATPKKDLRPADQTFLTFPEWYLVFSPEEQAEYFKKQTSTTFPYTSHIAQIWDSYAVVKDQIQNNFPPNKGYHFMIWVIGSSATVEYSFKAWYERVIGRLTDTGVPVTAEDKFNQEFTQDYVSFIKERPWYEFDFKSRLKSLWTSTPFSGKSFFRKVERRYLLTSELFVKYVYGKAIGLGTKQVYEVALPTTAVLLDNDSLHYLPRYDQFAGAAIDLAGKGHRFKEIAGNNSAILLTVLIPANGNTTFVNTKTVFTQPISSNMRWKRVALAVPVHQLATVLLQLQKQNVTIEHLFDF